MFTNLHTLPSGRAYYTLYVGQPDQPDLEEYDQVAPAHAPDGQHLVSLVILAAKDELVKLYGDKVEVRIVADQSGGELLFTSGQRGFRPIPVVLPASLTEAYNPEVYDGRQTIGYDVILDLCQDEHDGMGGADYLDALLGQHGAVFIEPCPVCGEPIDYCQGHGEIGDPEGRAILDAEMEG